MIKTWSAYGLFDGLITPCLSHISKYFLHFLEVIVESSCDMNTQDHQYLLEWCEPYYQNIQDPHCGGRNLLDCGTPYLEVELVGLYSVEPPQY